MGGVRKSMGENVKQEERGRIDDFRSLQFTQRLRDYKIKDSLPVKDALKKMLSV